MLPGAPAKGFLANGLAHGKSTARAGACRVAASSSASWRTAPPWRSESSACRMLPSWTPNSWGPQGTNGDFAGWTKLKARLLKTKAGHRMAEAGKAP